MRAEDGNRRPRPVASTSVSGERPRNARRASESAGHGVDRKRIGNAGRDRQYESLGIAETPKITEASEITEAPNSSSLIGLSRPTLIPHEEGIIDALNRGAVVRRLVTLVGILLIIITLGIIAATFRGAPTTDLVALATPLISLLSSVLGFCFGRAQRDRQHS